MNIHLFATDISALVLADRLPKEDSVTALILPENRRQTAKVEELMASSRWPYYFHARDTGLPANLPQAAAGIAWLYSQILRPEDLNLYQAGILNMHGGKIPAYRGANVLQWAIINGETELGITWHEMAPEVDSGPIWHETSIQISQTATASDLRGAMIAAGIDSFDVAWRRFRERRTTPRYPDLSTGRVWSPRRPRDGRISSGLSQFALRNLMRALGAPWPPAFIKVDGREVPVAKIELNSGPGYLPYKCDDGTILYLVPVKK